MGAAAAGAIPHEVFCRLEKLDGIFRLAAAHIEQLPESYRPKAMARFNYLHQLEIENRKLNKVA